jgi:hypothetical protein
VGFSPKEIPWPNLSIYSHNNPNIHSSPNPKPQKLLCFAPAIVEAHDNNTSFSAKQ